MGVVTVAALGTWLSAKRRFRHAASISHESDVPERINPPEKTMIDDDQAAEIIRRAQPALERARQFV